MIVEVIGEVLLPKMKDFFALFNDAASLFRQFDKSHAGILFLLSFLNVSAFFQFFQRNCQRRRRHFQYIRQFNL